MTTITATPASTSTTDRARVTWRSGLATVVGAAAVTAALAAASDAAGAALEVGGDPVPVFAFAQMVLLGGVIGIVLARHVRRTAFVRATVVLTALWCVPSLALGATVGDKLAWY